MPADEIVAALSAATDARRRWVHTAWKEWGWAEGVGPPLHGSSARGARVELAQQTARHWPQVQSARRGMRAVLFALGGSAWVGDGEQGRDAAPSLLAN